MVTYKDPTSVCQATGTKAYSHLSCDREWGSQIGMKRAKSERVWRASLLLLLLLLSLFLLWRLLLPSDRQHFRGGSRAGKAASGQPP